MLQALVTKLGLGSNAESSTDLGGRVQSGKLGLAGALAVGASVLSGCQSGPAPKFDFGPPPQESLTAVSPGVTRCERELSRIIESGPKIDASDGVTYDEAWRLMASYLLRRSDLSVISLNSGLASNKPDYTTIRDAQLFNQLGLMLESDARFKTPQPVPRADVLALGLLSMDDQTLVARAAEGKLIAEQFAAVLAQLDPDPRGAASRLVQKVAGIIEADLALLNKPGDLPPAAIKARLQEDVMIAEALKICVDLKLSQAHPVAQQLISTYSSEAGSKIQSDFAIFDAAWTASLPVDARETWAKAPATDRAGMWVLVRAIQPSAWTGNQSAPVVAPTTETARINGMITGQ
jgi:hypothetical protein